jgi:hypothetical protein
VTPEMLIAAVIAAGAVLGLVAKLLPKRKPPSPTFQCGRCGTTAWHNDRTSEAWRSGKTKFFCQACHAKWLQSRAPQERTPKGGSGCLGVVVLFALLPLGGLLKWVYA